LTTWSGEFLGLGGGGWGGPYYASFDSFTNFYGNGGAANRCGGGNGRATEGPGAAGGSGVVYVRYRA
jgi:hypothetical protein